MATVTVREGMVLVVVVVPVAALGGDGRRRTSHVQTVRAAAEPCLVCDVLDVRLGDTFCARLHAVAANYTLVRQLVEEVL